MPDEPENETSEDSNAKEDIYIGPKSRPKIVRVLTVLAYVLSVSMAAILLSVYYIFMWDGQPTLASRKAPQFENFEVDETGLDKLREIYNGTFTNNSSDVEFDALLKRLLLSGNATASALLPYNQSLQGELFDKNYTQSTKKFERQATPVNETTFTSKEILNSTKTKRTEIQEEGKQVIPPISTSSYEDNVFYTTTTTENVADSNTEAELSTLDFKDLGRRSLLYKKLFHRKLLK